MRINSSKRIAGSLRPLVMAGVPSDGTDEVQTLTTSGTILGGTFTLTYEGQTTAAIAWSATNATLIANIQAALRALSNIGASDVTVTVGTATSGIGTFLITFGGNLGRKNVSAITCDDDLLTGSGAAAAVTTTTPGVESSFRGSATKGVTVINSLTGKHYVNNGTAIATSYGVLGSQS